MARFIWYRWVYVVLLMNFLTPELAYHLGRAAATYFGKEKDHPTFLIGRDTRILAPCLKVR